MRYLYSNTFGGKFYKFPLENCGQFAVYMLMSSFVLPLKKHRFLQSEKCWLLDQIIDEVKDELIQSMHYCKSTE